MGTRIVFLQSLLEELRSHLFSIPDVEGAAFVLCGQSDQQSNEKLIAHAIVPIADEDYLRREKYSLSIASPALMRITKLARYENLSVVFAHSHPEGIADFSAQDDREEQELIPFLQSRVPGRIHGTVVLTSNSIAGRLYDPGRETVDAVVSVGRRFSIWPKESPSIEVIHDRQVRAFGEDVQKHLQSLHVGVVGAGGTGSAVLEQLCRLGVGTLSIFDGDELEETNVNRVYGSKKSDAGKFKVLIAKDHLSAIGLQTIIEAVPKHITSEEAARKLRACDLVFGCTDKQLPRAILNQLSLQYCIPVIDLGVLIDSDLGQITSVIGRVTTLYPGESCLFCRGRISPEAIRVEALSDEERASQAKEGYAPELNDPAPAVIAFTTAVASAAVAELLHRLTGFMGAERVSSEVLQFFDEGKIRTNRADSREMCICADTAIWGRGDEDPFLGMFWTTHTK